MNVTKVPREGKEDGEGRGTKDRKKNDIQFSGLVYIHMKHPIFAQQSALLIFLICV
jgi:hypothetical protein